MGENLLQQKSFEFALSMIRLYKKLQARQETILSAQLLKSGTSIGVFVEEANLEQNSESAINAFLLASKAARETRYWLRLLQESKLVDLDVAGEIAQLDALITLLNKIMP